MRSLVAHLLDRARSRLGALRVHWRRRRLLAAYARVGRIRHGLGPGFTPSIYALQEVAADGLATLRDGGELDWHWPRNTDGTESSEAERNHEDFVEENESTGHHHYNCPECWWEGPEADIDPGDWVLRCPECDFVFDNTIGRSRQEAGRDD